MSGARKDYLTWDEYFMLLAINSSMRSKDPKTQVGACIVKDKHVLSLGYNGTPPGITDDEMPWDSLGEQTNDFMNIKNTFVVHAEANSILSYNGDKKDLKDADIYVTLFPCLECTKQIITVGIKRVIYLNMYSKQDMVLASKYMLNKAHVDVNQFEEMDKLKEKVLSKFNKY